MIGFIARFKRASLWVEALTAYKRGQYAAAVALLQASKSISPLGLAANVLLANSLAGADDLDAAKHEYAICMHMAAGDDRKSSLFIFAYSAYMSAIVVGDQTSMAHFGGQLAVLDRPRALRNFVDPIWLP